MTYTTDSFDTGTDHATHVIVDRAAAFPRAATRSAVDGPRVGSPELPAAVARAWHELVEGLDGDQRAVEQFATIWLDLLPRRLASCRRALVAGDDAVARVRLLTLHSSAVMLGLERFAELTWRCQAAMDDPGSDEDVRALAREVIDEAQVAAVMVRAVLGQDRWSKR